MRAIFSSLFAVFLLCGGHCEDVEDSASSMDDPGPGHLKPLGFQYPSEGTIDAVDDFLDPKDFYQKYVLPGRPLLIKNGARDIPAYKLWNDDYLREKFGEEFVEIEMGKKEKRNGDAKEIRMKVFLKVYNESDIYMVQDAHKSMQGDLVLPKSLQCGGFQNQMLQTVLWFSSGGTKSVLHNDMPDNLNCILDGSKEIVFIDKKYEEEVRSKGWVDEGGYSKVDVESVDLNAFPQFKSLPWWSATMEKGDCLFIPYRWLHSVKSSESRNFAANLWFTHIMWFNQSDCDHNPAKNEHISLENVKMFGLETVENVRVEMFAPLEGKEEIHMEEASIAWSNYVDTDEVHQLFGLADLNHDMVLTWDEVYQIDMLHVAQTFPGLIDLFSEVDLGEVSPHDEL